jgi:hypothetical protein
VILLACGVGTASAQSVADYDYENLTFRGIGFDYGYLWPTKVESTSGYSLRFDLGYLGPGVRIAPVISYWKSTFQLSELTRLTNQLNRLPALQDRGVIIQPNELGTISWSDLSLSLDAHVVWTVPMRLFPYVGAAVGLHALNGQGTAIDETFVEDLLDSTAPAIAFMVGLEMQPLERLRFYGEARYTLLSDVRYPGVRIGAAWMLPQRTSTEAPTGR